MDSGGGVYQNTVKDHVGEYALYFHCPSRNLCQGIPINSCRITFTNETVIIYGIQATTFNSRHLFRQYTQFLHPPARAGRPNTSVRSGKPSWCATASGWMSEQPLQGCILPSGVYMVFAPSWWCSECGVALDTARQLWVSWVFSSQRLSRTTNVQDVHTLPSPHFLSPGPAVFRWLFPHTHPWVPTGSLHTEKYLGCFVLQHLLNSYSC